jgi:hypothetical protein
MYKYLRIRKLSRNGWKVIAGLILLPNRSPLHLTLVICGINLALTTLTFALPWWSIECWKNCDAKHYTIELDIGVCSVGKAGGFSESNCIKWRDSKTWEEIDKLYGTNTAHAANFIYPRVYKLTIISLCLSLLSLLISFFSLYQQKSLPHFPVMISQIAVILTATAFQIVVIFAQGLGSDNSITDGKTWRDYTGCSDYYDAPFYAYFTFAATQTLTLVMTFVAISPNRCSCFHLVAFDDNMEAMESFSSRQQHQQQKHQQKLAAAAKAGGALEGEMRGESSFASSSISDYKDDPNSGYSGIDYRMSLALNPEMLPSYSPPEYEDPNFEKI